MEYTEAVDREIEALEVFEKKSGLTEVGKKKIKALRKCRDDFKKLHLPVVSQQSELLNALTDSIEKEFETYAYLPDLIEHIKAFNCG